MRLDQFFVNGKLREREPVKGRLSLKFFLVKRQNYMVLGFDLLEQLNQKHLTKVLVTLLWIKQYSKFLKSFLCNMEKASF